MRLGLRKDIDWSYVGAKLAQDDDDSQVEFFKAFLKECGTWGTRFQVETQFASINIMLTEDEREALRMLSYENESK